MWLCVHEGSILLAFWKKETSHDNNQHGNVQGKLLAVN